MIRRRGFRQASRMASAIDPPASETPGRDSTRIIRSATNSAAFVTPTMKLLLVRRNTRTPWATFWSHVPEFDTSWPPKNRRKLRLRQTEDRSTADAGRESSSRVSGATPSRLSGQAVFGCPPVEEPVALVLRDGPPLESDVHEERQRLAHRGPRADPQVFHDLVPVQWRTHGL